MVVKIVFFFFFLRRVVLRLDTNVSEDCPASIFRVKVRGESEFRVTLHLMVSQSARLGVDPLQES
jgi:hypothetical protein